MLRVLSVVADVATIVAVFEVTKRYLKPAWLMSLGCWFNAQYWGPRADVPGVSLLLPRGCWSRISPKWLCGLCARLLLLNFEKEARAAPGADPNPRYEKDVRDEIYEKWWGIASRHVRRGWNGHPHHCRSTRLTHWCSKPGCHQPGTSLVRQYTSTGHVTSEWYCEEHIGDSRARRDPFTQATKDEHTAKLSPAAGPNNT